MKIRDGNTFKQIKMKAEVLDTLPINSIVDYEGDTVPEGWEEVVDNGECIVSSTEPTGEARKKLWLKHSKNLFVFERTYSGASSIGYSYSHINVSTNSSVTVYKTLTGTLKAGTYTIKNYSTLSFYLQTSSSDTSNLIANGESYTFTYDGTSYLRVYFETQSTSYSSYKVQLEQGSTATEYTQSVGTSTEYILNDNDIYEEFKAFTTINEVLATCFKQGTNIYKNVNWDNLDTGWYKVNTWTGTGGSNYPADNLSGACLVFKDCYQVCFAQTKIYARYKGNSAWGEWKYISLT